MRALEVAVYVRVLIQTKLSAEVSSHGCAFVYTVDTCETEYSSGAFCNFCFCIVNAHPVCPVF